MGSWTCSLCDTEARWPTKQQAMDHIKENHMDTLIRATLERSEDDPNKGLGHPHEPVTRDE